MYTDTLLKNLKQHKCRAQDQVLAEVLHSIQDIVANMLHQLYDIIWHTRQWFEGNQLYMTVIPLFRISDHWSC